MKKKILGVFDELYSTRGPVMEAIGELAKEMAINMVAKPKPFIIFALKRDETTGRVVHRVTKAMQKQDRSEVVRLANLLFSGYEVSVY